MTTTSALDIHSSLVRLNGHSVSPPVLVFMALLEWLKHSDAQTMAELSDKVHAQVSSLNSTSPSLSVRAGTDLFQRFVGRPHEASLPFESIKMKMLSEGAALVKACGEYREKTAQAGVPLIRDGMVLDQSAQGTRLKVIVTQSNVPENGQRVVQELRSLGVECVLVPDAAVGHVIALVDMVVVGAEAVTLSGGVINQIGTYQLAMIAQYANKPLYVVVESYKFVRQFPLSQSDLPSPLALEWKDSLVDGEEVKVASATVDYTPPGLISLLLTDFGILSPSDISEHLFFLENR